jgi:hypothetical protein
MRHAFGMELRALVPAWFVCLLVPLPAVLFWRTSEGRSAALGCFFVACVGLVAHSFGETPNADRSDLRRLWRAKMLALGLALFAAFVVFSLLGLTVNDAHDLDMPVVAFLILIPSLCTVPYLTLLTRKPFAAGVFALALVGCMKLLGGVVVVLVYGWDASRHGHTQMPWTDPNLLVWVFWSATGVYSGLAYALGYQRFFLINGKSDAGPWWSISGLVTGTRTP